MNRQALSSIMYNVPSTISEMPIISTVVLRHLEIGRTLIIKTANELNHHNEGMLLLCNKFDFEITLLESVNL